MAPPYLERGRRVMEAQVTQEGRPAPSRVDRRVSFCYHQNACSYVTRRRAMTRKKSPSWVLELPLAVRPDQAKRLQAHLEAARCLYNALLGEAKKRLNRMRSDPTWQAARAISPTRKQERNAAFSRLRRQYGFGEYAMHDYAKGARWSWIADHVDSTMAQTLASRAYQAVNRVCLGQAKQVRFRSKGRGM